MMFVSFQISCSCWIHQTDQISNVLIIGSLIKGNTTAVVSHGLLF